jgi:hypothetical protein
VPISGGLDIIGPTRSIDESLAPVILCGRVWWIVEKESCEMQSLENTSKGRGVVVTVYKLDGIEARTGEYYNDSRLR